jgi:hypothetical protein
MSDLKWTRKIALAAAMALALAGVSSIATAQDTQWQDNHPRREEVNKRLQNQNKRISKEVKAGEISPEQAKKLHKQDRKIRKEEKAMASQNGGHITKAEQKRLNRQENRVSKEIGN